MATAEDHFRAHVLRNTTQGVRETTVRHVLGRLEVHEPNVALRVQPNVFRLESSINNLGNWGKRAKRTKGERGWLRLNGVYIYISVRYCTRLRIW